MAVPLFRPNRLLPRAASLDCSLLAALPMCLDPSVTCPRVNGAGVRDINPGESAARALPRLKFFAWFGHG